MTVVRVSTGELVGRSMSVADTTVTFFGTVPYAAPPVGDRRFAPPVAPAPWRRPRDATRLGPAAPQVVDGDAPVPGMEVAATSEDCLTAQVWTPDPGGRKPVLVWIPGGAYQTGSASLPTYDGARLAAEQDIVVVGLNYRLGVLGYLFEPDGVANLGLQDLLAALRWLNDEIVAFGGDPERIVVMGESAGAGSICHLLAMPELADLIAGAIVQSGAPGSTLSRDTAGAVSAAFFEAAGVDSVQEARDLSLDSLLAAQKSAAAQLLGSVGMMPFHPVVDGEVLAATPLDAARAGTLAAVPLLIGTTQNEMELFRAAVPQLPTELVEAFLKPKLEPLLGRPATLDDVRRCLAAVDGDLVEAIAHTDLHVPAAIMVDSWIRSGLDVWRYQFGWQSPTIGAAHATDLPFTFGTLDIDGWRAFVGADGERATSADRLSARMRSAWGSFCRDLAPSCDPLGPWPKCSTTARPIVHLADDVGILDADSTASWLTPA